VRHYTSWRATLREWRSYPRKPTIPGGYRTVSNVPVPDVD